MSDKTQHEIVLYDLVNVKNICFSPAVWRVRLLLNYKNISYKTIFLEFEDIEPTLKPLDIPPNINAKHEYTVPAIHHIPTNTYVMDSMAITEFIQAKYPSPPFTLTSPLGIEIEKKARAASGKAFVVSIMPREVHIFSPRSQNYFRMSREAEIGCKLEDLLEPQGKEDKLWEASDAAMREVSDLLLTNAGKGPFILGEVPSASDFFLAGALQSARVVDEGVWQRNVRYEGFKRVYEACEPWLEKNT